MTEPKTLKVEKKKNVTIGKKTAWGNQMGKRVRRKGATGPVP